MVNWSFYIIWICFAIISGIIEAYLDRNNTKWDDKYFFEKHRLFLFARVLFVCMLVVLFFKEFQNWLTITLSVCILILVFAFFHDGLYFMVRNLCAKVQNKPKPYKYGFFDKGTSQDGELEISFFQRTYLILFALIISLLAVH